MTWCGHVRRSDVLEPVLCMFSSLRWMLHWMAKGRVVWDQGIMGVLMTPRGLLLTISLASLSRSSVRASADI